MTFLVVVILGAALFAGPTTALLMLALGNFGFAQFGFVDCLPAGIILAAIASKGSST